MVIFNSYVSLPEGNPIVDSSPFVTQLQLGAAGGRLSILRCIRNHRTVVVANQPGTFASATVVSS